MTISSKTLMFGWFCLTVLFSIPLSAQDFPVSHHTDHKKSYLEIPAGWTFNAGIGLDMAQLFKLNPRQGDGQSRLGLGGGINAALKHKSKRFAWESLGSWQFGVERIGSGVIAKGAVRKIPFQKTNDELRLGSKIGYAASEKSKFFYSADFMLQTQIAPSYEGTKEYTGFFLRDISGNNQGPLSKFFAPATFTISAGMDYKLSENFSAYFSPIAYKSIIVADDLVAARGVHGNPTKGEPDPETGLYSEGQYERVKRHFGALLRVNYTEEYANERIGYIGALTLYSNYLNHPENVDFDWTNELSFSLLKNLDLSLLVNIAYDDDVSVQITDYGSRGGIKRDETGKPILGKRVSLTQQLLIKYLVKL